MNFLSKSLLPKEATDKNIATSQADNIVDDINDTIDDISNTSQKTSHSHKSTHTPDLPELYTMLPPIINASLQGEKPSIKLLTQEMIKQDKSNFIDHFLALMVAAIAERNTFTSFDYEEILKASQKIFGDEALHSRFQTKLHANILHDYTSEEARLKAITDFQEFLKNPTYSAHLSPLMLESLYQAIYTLTLQDERKKYSLPSRFFEEFEIIFMEYEVSQKKKHISSQKDEQSQKSFFFLDKLNPKNLNFDTPSWEDLSSNKKSEETKSLLEKSHVKKFFSPLFSRIKESTKSSTEVSPYLKNDLLTKNVTEAELHKLENFALAFRNENLLKKIHTFRSLLLTQDFRIVILGEGKRGKTSILNALLGQELLPTRAVLPETGALVELYFSQDPRYDIEWISKNEFQDLEKALQSEKDNFLLQKKFMKLQNILNNKKIIEDLEALQINRIDELKDYISADGLYTPLVKKVRIGINSVNIPKGILLVDTPAINATDPFYQYLTSQECLKADCLILVLDSRQPDTYEKLQFIRELAKRGRAISIIGILTHPAEDKEEEKLAKQRALQTIKEGIRGTEGIKILGVFSFNPKQVLEFHARNNTVFAHVLNQKIDSEYLDFIETLTKNIQAGIKEEELSTRLKSSYDNLLDFAKDTKREEMQDHTKHLPSSFHLDSLQKHAKYLSDATEKYATHSRSLILSAIHDIQEWRTQSENSIKLLEDRIILHISKAIHEHANTLGDNFAKESQWTTFDEETTPKIARKLIDDFTEEQRKNLQAWEKKIQIFSNEVQELSLQCLSELQNSSADIGNLCATHSALDHMLVKTASHMQKVTLFLSGAGAGVLGSAGVFNILALGTATLAFLTNPIAIPSVLVLGAGAYALKAFANPIKRKEIFLQRKEAKTKEFAEKLSQELYEQLDQIQREIIIAYSQAVHKSIAPALDIMTGEAVNINLYLDVINKQNKAIQAK